jgi:FkbM family methyltransferase
LYRHLIVNQVQNVITISTACADSISLASFASGKNYATGSLSTSSSLNQNTGRNNCVVPVVTVDALAEVMGNPPDVIKIDVEGAEFSVLQGAQKTLLNVHPVIFLSVHSNSQRDACTKHLQKLNYCLTPLDGTMEDASEFVAIPCKASTLPV